MEFPLTEVSNGLIDTQIERIRMSIFQMPMEVERMKIGFSSGNHGIVTKSASASSSGNFIECSKEETEISAKARRRCALKNLANAIEKG
jgi:hypothetical protein